MKLLLFCVLIAAGLGCKLRNYVNTAKCISSSEVITQLSFCGSDVSGDICVPLEHPLWPEWTIEKMDFEVHKFVALGAEGRIKDELSTSPTFTGLQFTSNYKCIREYRKFACTINFPPCDKQEDSTLDFDESYCSGFASECGISDLNCAQLQ
ncbi:unnamed protein product [Moneuplotes crassus]|uniref:Uncharacterized protein n=1 Tax=Euplotes crassus TaxID=5936 RepID=A0AAD1Y271_EUPCR|nr:unnamed protein product [Moneuplotes crassus]